MKLVSCLFTLAASQYSYYNNGYYGPNSYYGNGLNTYNGGFNSYNGGYNGGYRYQQQNSLTNSLGTAYLASNLGGGLSGVVAANALTGGGGLGNTNNLVGTLALSNALGGTSSTGTGTSSDLSNLVLASSLTNQGAFGGSRYGGAFGGGTNALGTAYLANNVFGGGAQGALLANAATGAPASASNLVGTLALSQALGGTTGSSGTTTSTSSSLTPLLLASTLSNNNGYYNSNGYYNNGGVFGNSQLGNVAGTLVLSQALGGTSGGTTSSSLGNLLSRQR
jgi:hypothetical protein